MLIAVTGNIGSGKTKVAETLGDLLGAQVLDADLMCRELMEPGREGFEAFLRQGGQRFVTSSGMLDRAALRSALFRDPLLRKTLEAILHPLVRKGIMARRSRRGDEDMVVAEIPLLFESGWENDVAIVITVRADEEKLVERVVGRDGGDPGNVYEILAAQMDQSEKCRKADYVIDNSGEWGNTVKQVTDLAGQLKIKNSRIRDMK